MKFIDKKALVASIDGWRKEIALGQGAFDVMTFSQGSTRKVRRAAKNIIKSVECSKSGARHSNS
jgi:hypothetical protein